MGQDKAFLPVGGDTVIERILQRVTPLSDDAMLVTNTPEKYRCRLDLSSPEEPNGHGTHRSPRYITGCRPVSDVYPDKGSLGGIYTSIYAARHPHCLVVACDMPFLNADLLRHLISLAPGFDVVIPHIEDTWQTMHAIYGKNCLEPIARRLMANQLKVVGFFDDVRVRIVEHDEIARFDPTFRSFLNMNTPADWEYLQELAAEK